MDPVINIPAVKAGYWYCKSGTAVGKIKSSLFTHLFAAFAAVNPVSFQVTFPTEYKGQFQSFSQLARQNNPRVKTILSIGGQGSDPSIFASMTSNADSRQTFIDSSLRIARDHKFNGLSLNWQYPYTREEMANFGSLLTEWRAAVQKESLDSDNTPLLLTAAVFYSSDFLCMTYPIQAISDSLDWIDVMSYDLYTPDCVPKVTGPPAPLYNPTSQLSVDSGIRTWIHAGVPTTKIVIGLQFLGRNWLPVSAKNHDILSPAKGAAEIDPIPYTQILEILKGAKVVFDPSYVSHYCHVGTTWIGYDDKHSIATKVIYAKKKGLLGYIAWHVDDTDKNWTLPNEAFNAWALEDDQ